MQIQELSLPGVRVLRPRVFFDDRGFFRETFRKPLYQEAGIDVEFVQDNHSFSKRGTIRGMHFQRHPGQAKLVTVVGGKIFDVVVDIRPESATFGRWVGVYLDSPGDQIYVPVGFAHGFYAEEDAHVVYKVSTLYDPAEERSFRFDDPAVGIVWPTAEPLISDRDRSSPCLKEIV